MDNWLGLFVDISHLLNNVFPDIYSIGTLRKPSGGAGGELQYPPPYNVEGYIRFHVPKIDALGSARMVSGEALTIRDGDEKRAMTHAD